ncbi:uncharacterized protein BcabD6B2_37860 [Babesia caballi]|uniref:Membrane protein n=1 Tax=Babesia caballi TaxID=5871 RepID=A0AAV4LW00_BABCB|nr:membrane protein [Babesia caballi]
MLSSLGLWVLACAALSCGAKYERCDIVVDSSVCIRGGETVLLPSARRSGRVLHYRFDEEVAVDSSGSGHHGIGAVVGHAGFGGVGSSGYFRKNFVYLPSTPALQANEFSVLFYVFLLADDESAANAKKLNDYCPLVHKGMRSAAVSECAPEIAVNPRDGRVRVLLSLESSQTLEIESNCRLQAHQWYHLAVVKDKAAVTLYINGKQDKSGNIRQQASWTSSTRPKVRRLGTWLQLRCSVREVQPSAALRRRLAVPGQVRHARAAGRAVRIRQGGTWRLLSDGVQAVGRDEVQAEASAVLGGVEPSYITIGCTDCGKQEAMKACPAGYHLCNKFELYTGNGHHGVEIKVGSGGYNVALRLSIPANKVMAAASAEPSSGVALCCANLQS